MSVLLLLETPVAALAAWWFMGQGIKPATVPGLLLIIVGVTVVVTSGSGKQQGERAAAPHSEHRVDIPPYPAHAPRTRHVRSSPRTLSLRAVTSRDPRLDWAKYDGGESPTVTLTYHGAGAFDTLYLRRPHVAEHMEEHVTEEEPGAQLPAATARR